MEIDVNRKYVKLVDAADVLHNYYKSLANTYDTETCKALLHELYGLPFYYDTDETEPKHGAWMEGDDGLWHCSVCGETPSAYTRTYIPVVGFRFCPHCGTYMDS